MTRKPENEHSIRFTIKVGILAKKTFLSTLKDACFILEAEYEVEEEKGILTSHFRIKVTGNAYALRKIKEILPKIEIEE